jgi:hypothetical protein
VSALGLVLFVLGWMIKGMALLANAFATSVVRLQRERNHAVADTGVYAIVRHPFYAATPLVLVGMSLWLESYTAALVALVPVILVVVRLRAEERFLHRELPGYGAYAERAARRRSLRRKLLVELVEPGLQRSNHLCLLLNGACQVCDLLCVGDETLRLRRQRILELAILGKQPLLAILECGDFTRRLARPLNEGVDTVEHRLALADLILERSLAATRRPGRAAEAFDARDRAVDLADECIRVAEHA